MFLLFLLMIAQTAQSLPSAAPNRFLTSLSLQAIDDSKQYGNLANQLTSSIQLLSKSTSMGNDVDDDDTSELYQRMMTAQSELNSANTMFMRVSEAATKAMTDLTAVTTAVSHFVGSVKEANPSIVANDVVEVDRLATIATQSTSALLFSIESSTGESTMKVNHAVDMMANVTIEHEKVVNSTMDNLYRLLQNMVNNQQTIENNIAYSAANIVSSLPRKSVLNRENNDVISEIYKAGNESSLENGVRTKLLVSALRNITLCKYYSNTLTSKIHTFVEEKYQERVAENQVILNKLIKTVNEMMGTLTSFSIYTHLAQDGNLTALKSLRELTIPEQESFYSSSESIVDSMDKDKLLKRVYYNDEMKGMFTLLRLSLENEKLTSSIPHTVLVPIAEKRQEEVDQAVTTMLNQAVLRSQVSREKLNNYYPPEMISSFPKKDDNNYDNKEKNKPRSNSNIGEKIMKDMLHLAEDDLQKGHLKRADDFVDAKLIIDKDDKNDDENNKMSAEEKETVENTILNNKEEQLEDDLMRDEELKVSKERQEVVKNVDEEAAKEGKIVELQNQEMLLHLKKSEEIEIEKNEESEYSVLKLLGQQRLQLEKKAAEALNVNVQASESWSKYTSHTESSNKTNNSDNAKKDQQKLKAAVSTLMDELKSTNKLEKNLADYRVKFLEAEVAKSKATSKLKEFSGEDTEIDGDKIFNEAGESALAASVEAAKKQNIVKTLISERSIVGMEANLDIQKLADDRVQSIETKKNPSSLLESLLISKARYARTMMHLVRQHKMMAREALNNAKKWGKEEIRVQQLKKNGEVYMSKGTKMFLKQKKAVRIGQEEFQSFFKKKFTKEQVAKEMTAESEPVTEQ